MTTPEELEARLRRAAERHHDEIASTVDLESALSGSQRRARRPVAVAMMAAVVVALVAAALLVRQAGDEVDVAIDEDGLEDVEPDEERDEAPATPDFDNAPAPIGLGAPDDGKDSVGLPIIVEPATGLVDGQTVTVSGKGFPPGESIGVVMCTKEAGQDHGGRGVEACNIGHFASGTSDSQGVATVEFRVRRLVMLDGEAVDCASEPGRCIIGMGMVSDYDQSGGAAVDFDPSVPLPDPPTVELSKTEDLADGETVDVTVTGLVPNSMVFMQQCSTQGSCADTANNEAQADETGTLTQSIRLWRNFGAYGPVGPLNVDCAEESCQLTIIGEVASSHEVPATPLTFDATRGGRTAPVLRLLEPGPFGPGDRFRVEVSGTSEGQFIDLQVCSPTDGMCSAHGYAEADDGTTIVEMTVEDTAACSGGCPIQGYVYTEGPQGPRGSNAPPTLFPEPIMVTITG